MSRLKQTIALVGMMLMPPRMLQAQAAQPQTQTERAVQPSGEANLILPDLSQVDFRGVNARTLLSSGLVVCVLGLLFGLMVYTETKNLPGIGSGLLVGSAVESSAGRHLEALRMLAAAIALRESTGASAPQMPMVMGEVQEAALNEDPSLKPLLFFASKYRKLADEIS